MFSTADWIVLIIYLVGITLLGSSFAKGQKSLRDYLKGGKQAPWWAVSFAIITTETSALTFIGVPSICYFGNMAFIQIVIGYVIARVLIALIILPTYYKQDITSPYEVLGLRIGGTTKNTAGVIFFITGVLGAGVRLFATAIPLSVIIPSLSITNSIIIIGVFTIIYTMLGGIKGVIWTEVAQFLIFFLGGLFAFFYIPFLVEGGWSETLKIAFDGGKLHWFNFGTTTSAPFIQLEAPYTFLMGVFGATFLTMASHGTDQLMVQLLLTCHNLRESQKAIIGSAVLILPVFLMFLFIGAWMFAFYENPANATDLSIMTKNDQIFPIFIVYRMPVILRGILISGLFATAMSSLSSAMAALSSIAINDFYKPYIRPKAEERHYLKASRGFMIFWGLALITVAFLSQNVKYVLEAGLTVAALSWGSLLGAMLLAIFVKRGHPIAVAIAMIAAFATIVTLWSSKAPVYWPWYVTIGTIITFFGGLLLSLLFRRLFPPARPAGTEGESSNP